MATYLVTLLIFSQLFVSTIIAQQPPSLRPQNLLLRVVKDIPTLQYVTTVSQRTPLVPINVTLDLGGQFLWVDCEQGYVSSTYRPARCGSAQCRLANSTSCGDCFSPPRPGCNNNTCGLFPDNTVTLTATGGELASDVLSVQSTDGRNPGRNFTLPGFLFVCAPTFLLQGLAAGVKGMAGLGRTNIALPTQLLSPGRKFSICLSSGSSGVVFFGNGPYYLLPSFNVSNYLIYTPLIVNPVSTAGAYSAGEPSAEYFIGVTSIKINNKTVPFNETLLSIDGEGFGGTKISSVVPYTAMQSSIYNAVVDAFVNEVGNASQVAAVPPFGACFNATSFPSTRVGLGVPTVDLVLQNDTVYWRIFGANSMVQVSEDVVCLGFVDGGVNPRTSIVIGGHQIEDNFLEFDV